jgi:hypothetical protein
LAWIPSYDAAASVLFAGASDFGTTGLIKMPDARMEEDGTFERPVRWMTLQISTM